MIIERLCPWLFTSSYIMFSHFIILQKNKRKRQKKIEWVIPSSPWNENDYDDESFLHLSSDFQATLRGWRKNFNFVSTTKSNFSHFRSRQNLMNERDFSMYTDSNNFSWFCTIKHETMMKCARSNFLVREIVVESARRKRKNQMKLKNEFILAHNYTQFL